MIEAPFYAVSSVPNTSVEIIEPDESTLPGYRQFNIVFPDGTFTPGTQLHILAMTKAGSNVPIVGFATHNSTITSEGAGTVLYFENPLITQLAFHIISVHPATVI